MLGELPSAAIATTPETIEIRRSRITSAVSSCQVGSAAIDQINLKKLDLTLHAKDVLTPIGVAGWRKQV